MTSRILIAAILIVVALLVAAYVRGGYPYSVYQSSGSILALDADTRGVFWLEGSAAAGEAGGSLYVMDRNVGEAQCTFSEGGLLAMASAGEAIVALQRAGEAGALVLVPRGGGQSQILVEGLSRPAGLTVHEGSVYWTETQAPLAPHARHIPVAQARTVLRSLPLAGGAEPQTLARIQGSDAGFEGKLLGGHGGRVFLLEAIGTVYPPGWSAIRSVPVAGGAVETVTVERGGQTGTLAGDELYWTAPSEDAGNPLSSRCVRRTLLPEIAPTTLTDWLMPRGTFCRADNRVYYGALDGVWPIPDSLAPPQPLHPVRLGPGLIAGREGAIYEVAQAEGGDVLLRRPVTLAGRLRAGMRLK